MPWLLAPNVEPSRGAPLRLTLGEREEHFIIQQNRKLSHDAEGKDNIECSAAQIMAYVTHSDSTDNGPFNTTCTMYGDGPGAHQHIVRWQRH